MPDLPPARLRPVLLHSVLLRTVLLHSVLLLGGCAASSAVTCPAPEAGEAPHGHAFAAYQTGTASFYGPGYHGRATASGEVFDQYALTAAHRTLPLGTVVRVTNLANCRRLVLRVNDRGPFIRGRILDVSLGAAEALDFVRQGLTEVQVEVAVPAAEATGAPARAPKPRAAGW